MINTDLHPRRNQVTTPRVGDVWIHGNGKTAVVTGAFTSMDGLFDEPRISLDGGAPAYIGWLVGQGWDPYELAEYAQLRRERDAALAEQRREAVSLRIDRDAALIEQRRAVARLAEVSAERDRLLAVVVAQAEAGCPVSATERDTRDEAARLRAALAVIALGNVRSPERFASLILVGYEVDPARAEDERRWRAEVGA